MPSTIFDLCDDYVNRHAALDPVWATYGGIQGHDGRGTDYGPDGFAARADLIRDTLRQLATMTPGDGPDRLAAAHLRERLEAQLGMLDAGEWMRDLAVPFGRLFGLRDSVGLIEHTDDDGWQAVARRLSAIPQMLASWRRSLSLGLARGLPAARRQAIEAADQADRYATGTHDGLVAAYDGPLRDELRVAVAAAHAGYAETAEYLRHEYAPAAAPADGVGAERHGLYRLMSLGADLDPVEAYEWGWAELRRLEAEMSAETNGRLLDEVEAELDATEVVVGTDAYRAWLQDEQDAAVERVDGRHFDFDPRLRRLEARLAPSSTAGAPNYTRPSEDFQRPGRTWWPVSGRDRFTVWRELTTVFHEGVPGHHLQMGHMRAQEGLSRFSRMSWVSGNAEGWALYAERLADELGWFDRPGSRLGMLEGAALRAARVVIDIGLHLDLPLPPEEARRYGPRWTFQVGARVLRERGRCAEHRVHSEMVRYCGWPAQAIAYKLGERIWLAARADAQRRLGPAFDLKRWHTQAIAVGPVGLDSFIDELRRVVPV